MAYVKQGKVNASLPEGKTADDISIEEAIELLAAKKSSKKVTSKKKNSTKKTTKKDLNSSSSSKKPVLENHLQRRKQDV